MGWFGRSNSLFSFKFFLQVLVLFMYIYLLLYMPLLLSVFARVPGLFSFPTGSPDRGVPSLSFDLHWGR